MSRAGLTLDTLPAPVREALGQARALKTLPQGMTSRVALVKTDRGPRVVKRARGALYAGWLEKEYRALQALTPSRLPIPAPYAFVPMPAGVVPEAWLVRQHLPGRPLSDVLSDGPSPARRAALLRAFGQTLAALHATPAPAGVPHPAPSWVEFMLEEAGENLEHFNVDGTAELLGQLRAHWQAGALPPIAPCLIHGDYTLDNVLVEDERISGLIDWAGCAVGDPRYDVALATRAEDEAFSGPQRAADLEAFFAGYGSRPSLEHLDFFVKLYEFF